MRIPTHLINASFPFLLAVASACAGSKASEVKDEQLGQLPREDRQAIIDQERSVDIAKANVDAAKASAQQAHEFRDMVGNELDAAKANRDAVDNSANVKYGTNKQAAAADANARRQLAAQQVSATEAKSEYADKLIDVREAEVEQREAEHNLAKARLEHSKYDTLRQRGLGENINRQNILDNERDAEQKRAEASQKVMQLQGYADSSKKNWDGAQQQYQASAKSTHVDERPVQVPPPPKYIPQASVKERSGKDAAADRARDNADAAHHDAKKAHDDANRADDAARRVQ
jgi:hypothetical protein